MVEARHRTRSGVSMWGKREKKVAVVQRRGERNTTRGRT
jgi:hypothetical protein